jgi:hypothetical protein
MNKIDVIDMLNDIRMTCFDEEGDEINSETISVIDEFIESIQRGE